MKKNTIISMICTLFVAMFLLSSCSVEYRANHHRHYDHHESNYHDDHDNHDSYHR